MSTSSPRAVVFGAGAVGRGFVAPLLSDAGWHVTFVDVVPALIDALNRDGAYDQVVVDNSGRRPHRVGPVSAVSLADTAAVAEALAGASIVATSVGAANLAGLAPGIVAGIAARRDQGAGPMDVLLCENLHDAGPFVRKILDDAYGADTSELVGLAETSVGRMIPSGVQFPDDPTAVAVEPYSMLPYDGSALLGSPPDVAGLIPVESNFAAYGDRKLYLHNMGHCMAAYLAEQVGATYVWEAVARVDLLYLVRSAMVESATALTSNRGLPGGALLDHTSDLLHRFGNRELGDTAQRVGRDPVRKMQPDDRLLGSYSRCLEANVAPLHVSLALALGAWKLEQQPEWSRGRVDRYLTDWLDAERVDQRWRTLLKDQRDLLREQWSSAAQLRRIDEEFSVSRIL